MIYYYTILHNIPVIKQFTVFFELRTQNSHLRTDNVCRQIYVHIFAQNRGCCLFNGFLHSFTRWLFFVSTGNHMISSAIWNK